MSVPEKRLALIRQLAVALIAGTLTVAGAQEGEKPVGQYRFDGYPNAPEFSVVPRQDELFFFPCEQCHASMEPNPEIRELDVMHDSEVDHGGGRLWCTNCHDIDNPDYLKTLLGEPVDFDASHLVCSGCHASRHRDWTFGIHGKRVANWQGEREVYNCTHCHNPHQPALAPRAPQPPPPVRAGLERQEGDMHEQLPPWQRREEQER